MENATVRTGLAIKAIRTQFPDSPEGKLMSHIVATAITDAYSTFQPEESIRSASEYLKGNIPHAEIAGVDSDWIKRILLKLELTDDLVDSRLKESAERDRLEKASVSKRNKAFRDNKLK